jgi:GNAT superfamily N-acetyltransferase
VTAREILALYDRHERRQARPNGVRVETTPHVVRHVGRPGDPSWVVWSDLAGADVDAAISGERAYFGCLRRAFEWKHFDHDAPADLPARLMAAGFQRQAPEALLALDLGSPPAWLDEAPAVDVRSLGPEGLADFAAVTVAVWPDLGMMWVARLREELTANHERTRLFVAYVGGAPVSVGRLESAPGSPFVGTYGGATLPSFRGRGLYRALVAARARFALALGARFLVVDAGAMSEPILRRLGFVHLITTTPFVWAPPGVVP